VYLSSGARFNPNDTPNARHPPTEAAFGRRAQAFSTNMTVCLVQFAFDSHHDKIPPKKDKN